jgi:hypothetical protein
LVLFALLPASLPTFKSAKFFCIDLQRLQWYIFIAKA